MKGEEYKLEEYHCASNKHQPVRITSGTLQLRSSLYKKHSDVSQASTLAKRQFFTKTRSNTICYITQEPDPVRSTANSNGNGIERGTRLFKIETSITSSVIKEELKPAVDSEMEIKRSSTDDSDSGKTSQKTDLKEKLTESLSPSPFRNQDPEKREEKLERLVASSEGSSTKNILFTQFYGSELSGGNSCHAWKIALKDHIVHTLESICIIKNLKPVPSSILEKKMLPVEDNKSKTYKKTVVFDLDETLAHCVTDGDSKCDHEISVPLNTGEVVKAGVNIRPYVFECLTKLAEHYELMVFTASHQHYADVVIDILDPKRTIFSKRLFRNSCIHTDNGLFIKDLRILNVDLKSVVIVDNAVFSFAFQLDNGIPIVPFYDDKEDKIMPKITDYLLGLKDIDDVRVVNRKTFSLTELYTLNVPRFLKYYYEDEDEDMSKGIKEEEEKTQGPQTKMLRRKSMSFAKVLEKDNSPDEEGIKIGKKAQAVVEDQLGKLRSSLPKYLVQQQESESNFKSPY